MKGKGCGDIVKINNATVAKEIICEFSIDESNAIIEVGTLKTKKKMQFSQIFNTKYSM